MYAYNYCCHLNRQCIRESYICDNHTYESVAYSRNMDWLNDKSNCLDCIH